MKNLLLLLIGSSFIWLFGGCGGDSSGEETPVYLRISAHERLVTNAKGSFNILVSSNTKWQVESKASWLKPDKISGTGEINVKIDVEANAEPMRSGKIIFSADGVAPKELTVQQSELTFKNPVAGIPDPWIVKHGDYYYLCKSHGSGISISKSDKLSVTVGTKSVWSCPADVAGIKVWNRGELWAPELHYVDGKWYVYYAAGRPASESGGSYKLQRTGVLRAKTDDPMGAWEDMGMLYTGDNYSEGVVATAANANYAIDMGVFYLNGQLYASWSGNPEGSGDQMLYIATMSNPYTISSSRAMISKPEKNWELHTGKINEGPAFLKNKEKGKFFIVYSCNGAWSKNYRLGYIELSDTLSNPMVMANWVKSANQIFYRCDESASFDGVNGVGHCSFTKSPDETEDWIVYHVKNRNDNTWSSGRSTFLKKFTWDDNGVPVFGVPVGWGESIALPSGETQ